MKYNIGDIVVLAPCASRTGFNCGNCGCARPGIVVDIDKMHDWKSDKEVPCYVVLVGTSKRRLGGDVDLMLFDDWCKNPVCWGSKA